MFILALVDQELHKSEYEQSHSVPIVGATAAHITITKIQLLLNILMFSKIYKRKLIWFHSIFYWIFVLNTETGLMIQIIRRSYLYEMRFRFETQNILTIQMTFESWTVIILLNWIMSLLKWTRNDSFESYTTERRCRTY